jgi:endonuclease/exonuclease/phosphatase family metal-dependent hydrolase
MSYNIEHMNKMFENNAVRPNQDTRAQHIASVIQGISPHVLGICEAANAPQEHQHFINNYLQGTGYQLAHGISRGGQNLVIYYRAPFTEVSVDDEIAFYNPWDADVEDDGLKERHRWERKPLEVLFEIGQGGPRVRIILVHAKSKGVFSVVDLHNFQKIALANRKRLVGQANKLRSRLDQLLEVQNPTPVIVMGDMNDGPGLDPFEMMVGKSFVETVMGSVYDPNKIFHNSLWWMTGNSQLIKNLWTADFPDPIVSNPLGYNHRIWIDHILLSPDMLQQNNSVRYILNSGTVAPKDNISRAASDHFAVYCTIET